MLVPIDVQGPATVGSVVWRSGPQMRITVIVKTSVGYDDEGRIRAIDPCPIEERDFAPFLRGSQIICDGLTSPSSLQVARSGDVLLEREVADGSALGAVAADEDLARFGTAVPTLEPGTDGHRFSTAPAEQRIGVLQGNERFSVGGPEVTLPPLDLDVGAKTGSLSVPFSVRLDTLLLTPNENRFVMIWRGSFPVAVDAVDALRLCASLTLSRKPRATGNMPALGDERHTTPFAKGDLTPPPLAKALHTNTETGTLKLGGFIARSATPFEEPNVTMPLSREELKKAAAAEPLPFPEGETPKPAAPMAPIPGAPWSAAKEEEPAEPPELEMEPPPEPKTAEEIERDRPKEAWAKGAELDMAAAREAPKRAPRKDVRALLYEKPKKK